MRNAATVWLVLLCGACGSSSATSNTSSGNAALDKKEKEVRAAEPERMKGKILVDFDGKDTYRVLDCADVQKISPVFAVKGSRAPNEAEIQQMKRCDAQGVTIDSMVLQAVAADQTGEGACGDARSVMAQVKAGKMNGEMEWTHRIVAECDRKNIPDFYATNK